MGKLNEAKIFGGIGAILTLLGFIPWIGPIFNIVGLVLIILAVKYISDVTKDSSIFKNYLINFICWIIAIGVTIFIIAGSFFAVGGFDFISELENEEITDFESFIDYFGDLIAGVVAALVIGWVVLVIGAVYLRRSYNSIADHTHVDIFRTTGTVFFIGALTTIILVGFLILIIGTILEIVSFFSLPEELPKKVDEPKKDR